MYKTRKIRIRMTKSQRERLFAYETLYHEELKKTVNLLHEKPKAKKAAYTRISRSIHKASRWTMYQLALKKVTDVNTKGSWNYKKSSSWHPSSFFVAGNHLLLYYESFEEQKEENLELAGEKEELEQLRKGKMVRMDLVHDEMYWFANFLIMEKEE